MEVEIPSEKDFESINQKAKNLANTFFSDLIEQAIDELNPDNDYIIDLLEIDLGEIDFDNPQTLIQKFLQILRKELSYQKASAVISKSSKFENIILQFIEYGTIPWWLDPAKGMKLDIINIKFSLDFYEKVKLLLLDLKTNFYRLKNFLGSNGFDQFIKQILKKNYSFYIHSHQLLEVLIKKTEHKWISANFDKRELHYLLFKGISVVKPNKKDILLTVLKQFAELTKQSIEEVFDISKTLIKNRRMDFSKVLNSIVGEYQRNQKPQNLKPIDASLILISYIETGFEELPPGYSENLVLDRLFALVINKYKSKFLIQLKASGIKSSPLKFQRLLSLFLRGNLSPSRVFLSEEIFSFFSQTISFIKSSQIINLLERQKISSDRRNIDISVLRFIIQHDFSTKSDKYLLEDFLKRLSKDFDIEYKDLIQEIYLSFKPRQQEINIAYLLEKIYNKQIISKYSYQPFAALFDNKKRLEKTSEMTYFQRESLNYFVAFVSNSPFPALVKSYFDSSTDLMEFKKSRKRILEI